MAVCRAKVLDLYRQLLRESGKFTSYNYRSYFLHRVKEEFRKNKNEINENNIKRLYSFGQENLEIIKRQVLIGGLYPTNPLVIEKNKVGTI